MARQLLHGKGCFREVMVIGEVSLTDGPQVFKDTETRLDSDSFRPISSGSNGGLVIQLRFQQISVIQ